MLIPDAWTALAPAGSGVVLQKQGTQGLSICYAASAPTGAEPKFGVQGNEPHIYPAVTGKAVYARALKGDVSISHEAI